MILLCSHIKKEEIKKFFIIIYIYINRVNYKYKETEKIDIFR